MPLPFDLSSVQGWLSDREAEELYTLATMAHGDIVEVGAYRGRSTIALALGALKSQCKVYSIDPHHDHEAGGYQFGMQDNTAFMQNILAAGVAQIVRIINLPSQIVAPLMRPYLAFIDGDHSYEACKLDFDTLTHPLRFDAHGYVAVHDSTGAWPGPTRVVNEARDSGKWKFVAQFDNLTVLQKENQS